MKPWDGYYMVTVSPPTYDPSCLTKCASMPYILHIAVTAVAKSKEKIFVM
jgi:hypothetical protein